jgi:hypothetical protein
MKSWGFGFVVPGDAGLRHFIMEDESTSRAVML